MLSSSILAHPHLPAPPRHFHPHPFLQQLASLPSTKAFSLMRQAEAAMKQVVATSWNFSYLLLKQKVTILHLHLHLAGDFPACHGPPQQVRAQF